MIGLLEPMKTSSVPVLLQLSSPVVKIVSGEPGPGRACVKLLDEAWLGREGPEGPCPFSWVQGSARSPQAPE